MGNLICVVLKEYLSYLCTFKISFEGKPFLCSFEERLECVLLKENYVCVSLEANIFSGNLQRYVDFLNYIVDL